MSIYDALPFEQAAQVCPTLAQALVLLGMLVAIRVTAVKCEMGQFEGQILNVHGNYDLVFFINLRGIHSCV